jgi:hypothetical protein
MFPPTAVTAQTIAVNGRTYSASPGSALDVPDFDAGALAANAGGHKSPLYRRQRLSILRHHAHGADRLRRRNVAQSGDWRGGVT